MDVNALRTWGIAASAAAIAALTTFALTARDEPAAEAAQTETQGVAEIAQSASDDVVLEAADAAASPRGEALGFLVRFRGQGPLARAQAEAAQGQEQVAQRAIETQLARQAAFRGLCFDRFTVGAAEVVLRTCAVVPAAARARMSQSWLRRLNAMPGVAYADANATVTQDRR